MTASSHDLPSNIRTSITLTKMAQLLGNVNSRIVDPDIALVKLRDDIVFHNCTFQSKDQPTGTRLQDPFDMKQFDKLSMNNGFVATTDGQFIAVAMRGLPTPTEDEHMWVDQAWEWSARVRPARQSLEAVNYCCSAFVFLKSSYRQASFWIPPNVIVTRILGQTGATYQSLLTSHPPAITMLASLGLESPMAESRTEMSTYLVADYGVPHSSRHVYTGKRRLRTFLERKYRDWTAGVNNASQYVAALEVTPDVIQWWDNNRRNLPPARLQYSEGVQTIIWKFAGLGHGIACGGFQGIFDDSCRAWGITLYHLLPLGSGRCVNQDRSKEPDKGYKPLNSRPRMVDRPTIVLEAGYSECLAQLRCDAHHWLTQTNGEVHIVVLLHINHTARTIRLERWELVARYQLRSQNTHRPAMMQYITISVPNPGMPIVVGAPLIIPVDKLFDQRPPQVPVGNLTITRQQLEQFAFLYFQATQ